VNTAVNVIACSIHHMTVLTELVWIRVNTTL